MSVSVEEKLPSSFLQEAATCPPPDFPEGGRYEPVKPEYEVGQTITYSCNDMAPMFIETKACISGEKVVTCQSSGKWSRGTPFCETSTKSQVSSIVEGSTILAVFDGNVSTCRLTRNNSEDVMAFSFDHEVMVYFAILCFGGGGAMVKIKVFGTLEKTFNVDDSGKYSS
ncbi:hypothetical protein AVEN_219065-1 [Araneus ventricosus]|uniref:Sushi domain-containing protein n=1 Tax=Araneus ventricosus TaxID=182803 RepID=A0A4Y2GC46_ARAVE|nr:hypothetical protein AVEN_219065-1 [Araneus ventricosus]